MELLVLLAVLQVGDILTTLRFVKAGVQEANPVLRELFNEVGVLPVLLAVKGMFLYVMWISMSEPYWNWIAGGFCAVYAWVVIHNWKAVK